MTPEEDFVPLLQPRDQTELELARNLLDQAGVRNTVLDTDRVEMLRVLEGASAEGLQILVVPRTEVERAIELLREAWGDEALEGRLPKL